MPNRFRADADAMSIDVSRAKPLFDQDRDRFRQFFTAQASLRDLPTAMMLTADGTILLSADIQLPPEFKPPAVPPPDALAKAVEGAPQVGFLNDANYVGAVTKLRGYDDIYLYVARFIDPQVLAQIRETQTSIAQWANLEARRLGVQIAFALMYTVIALTVLLSSVWIGLAFANRLVAPIRRLISAADIVSTGNLHVQVPVRRSEGDLAQLGATFNKMTQELRTQRNDLVRARDVIDSRRRFTEAVLAGARRGRHRRRRQGPDQHPQPLRREARRLQRGRRARAAARGGCPRAQGVHRPGDERAPSASSRATPRSAAPVATAPSRCA